MMIYVDVWVQLVDLPPISIQAPLRWIPSVVRYGDAALFVLSLASDDILSEAEEVLETLEAGKVHLARKGEDCGMFDNGISSLRTTLVLTRAHDPDADARYELLLELIGDSFDTLKVDLLEDLDSVESLRKSIYLMQGKTRVYTKQPGKPPDQGAPFVIDMGTTLEEMAGKIHKDIRNRLQYARIWSANEDTYDGQRVARDYVLQEGDIVEIHA